MTINLINTPIMPKIGISLQISRKGSKNNYWKKRKKRGEIRALKSNQLLTRYNKFSGKINALKYSKMCKLETKQQFFRTSKFDSLLVISLKRR